MCAQMCRLKHALKSSCVLYLDVCVIIHATGLSGSSLPIGNVYTAGKITLLTIEILFQLPGILSSENLSTLRSYVQMSLFLMGNNLHDFMCKTIVFSV